MSQLSRRVEVDPSSFTHTHFVRLRTLIYQRTGIYFEDVKFDFVQKRVLSRMQTMEVAGFSTYFARLRLDTKGLELQELINLLTVNETYFYREDYQFDCMVNSVLPELMKGRDKRDPIRIWSAPCSTGEEPYSIALTLLERWPALNDIDVEITGSDIDTGVLERAKRGVFSARSVQYVPPKILKRHFNTLGQDAFQISDEIRQAIEFRHTNVVNTEDTKRFRDYDIIFCRNMLIYFDDASRRLAADAFYDALRPGGFIFLGHSESMGRISSLFQPRRFPECIAYQRPPLKSRRST